MTGGSSICRYAATAYIGCIRSAKEGANSEMERSYRVKRLTQEHDQFIYPYIHSLPGLNPSIIQSRLLPKRNNKEHAASCKGYERAQVNNKLFTCSDRAPETPKEEPDPAHIPVSPNGRISLHQRRYSCGAFCSRTDSHPFSFLHAEDFMDIIAQRRQMNSTPCTGS